jgi:hypothetical protein
MKEIRTALQHGTFARFYQSFYEMRNENGSPQAISLSAFQARR